MKQFQRILVAIDFSEYSQATVEHAAILARELGAEMNIVNVINQRDVNTMDYSINRLNIYHKNMSLEGWIEGMKEEREKEMARLEKTVDLSGLRYTFSIRIGDPFQELLKMVTEGKAEMVVMGAKGRSDLGDFVVGSTASKMFRRCPVPLVTVRNQK
ncbi:MAG: universal stress protein [bacterium]